MCVLCRADDEPLCSAGKSSAGKSFGGIDNESNRPAVDLPIRPDGRPDDRPDGRPDGCKTEVIVETIESGSSEPETDHSADSDDEPPARGRGKVFPSGRARTAEDDAEDAKPKRGGRKKQTACISTEGPAPTVQCATNAIRKRKRVGMTPGGPAPERQLGTDTGRTARQK
jgi:hypothetical protein